MSTVWGIDPSTKCIALAIVRDGDPPSVVVCESLALEQARTPQLRLARAVQDLVPWFGAIQRGHRTGCVLDPPRLVVVEQPFGAGRQVHPQSHMMIAAVLISLVGALGQMVDVRMLGPSQWKKQAYDHGGLGKGDLKIHARAWWPVDNQDEADAVGIALAAARCV